MQPSVGKNVDSWCTRCRLVLAHTVESMVGTKITRVHCNTCRAQHAYRPHPPGTAAAVRQSRAGTATRTPGSPKSALAAPQAGQYDTLLKGRTAAAARRYSTSERFKAAELISHATFGLGVVTADKGAGKIEVLFPNGPKTLIHGR